MSTPSRQPRCRHPLLDRLRPAGIALVMLIAPALAGAMDIVASDAGFVTEVGGSAKGDGTVVPAAKYNYSVGFEEHYGSGALGAPLVPMLRKNYFVFDLSGLTTTIASAKLKLWTGTFESVDPSEVFALHETTDVGMAAGLASDLLGGASTGDFDEPTDPLVGAAALLYSKLADGPLVLASALITSALDDSFIEIEFGAAGVAYLNTFLDGVLVLGGLVPSVDPPPFPQQPFGGTGPDIPGGDPLTPVLMLTPVPEPTSVVLLLAGGVLLAARRLAQVRGRQRP